MSNNPPDDLKSLLKLMFDPIFGSRALLGTPNVYNSEPPYARVLMGLGLFDPIELPKTQGSRQRKSTFPAVVHSGNNQQERTRFDDRRMPVSLERVSGELDRISDELKHDGGQIIDSIGEVFGETSRWAMGTLLGHLRNAADNIETRIQREGPEDDKKRDAMSSSLYQAVRGDLITNFDRLFPEPSDDDKSTYSYYHVTTSTMPDGSVETRKVLRDKDGSEKTTVIRHYPDSKKEDEVTVTTDSKSITDGN
ncbi:hypothetical protein IW137_000493 [Coemansia sp. RSA 1287]|nr:hypothetical protein J3F82_005111 [Coemansia sp. RSA 637]KAJ2256834.1 hypothetical protein GGH98_001243 [Coemansia sp. RSA 454]KAJ2267052.1 hypothetical protein GGH14_006165 [Coemansia sp. RSA 370]KAJ2651794.1 hypothetical protein IW137_000493 [Coemansia sp. RSA 1287]